MGNVIITNSCNLNCPFCFATETKCNDEIKFQHMPLDEFRSILKFDHNVVTNLCGGEPTTHPKFTEMLEELLSVRGKYINVLTNGTWSEKVRKYIAGLPFEKSKRIVYLFNVLQPDMYTEKQKNRLYAALDAVNPETAFIGFTIYKYPFDYSYILEMARTFGIRRIRYSIAAPNIHDSAAFQIDPAQDFRELADVVYDFIMDARALGLEVNPDCGSLPPCAYTPEQLAELMLVKPGLKFNCNAVVDIAQGGEAWRCYSLYSIMKANTKDFSGIQDLTEYFNRRTRLLADIDILDECRECEHKRSGLCYGGCLSYHVIAAWKKDRNYSFFPIDNDVELLSSIPHLDYKVLTVWEKSPDETIVYVRRDQQLQTKTLRNDPVFLAFIKACDGKTAMKNIIENLAEYFNNSEEATAEVMAMARLLFDQYSLHLGTALASPLQQHMSPKRREAHEVL
ncbi:radical SAM protein [Paenibacillus sp. FSL M7-0896]|uniref:radical SAM protein n=1 Tax=Paenibacillus sp. FSL M7-0896 TaxID=2921610 RepID=UPI0030D78ED5